MPVSLKRGNLVLNGGFEQGFAGWLGTQNVKLAPSSLCHEGLVAAAMGDPCHDAQAAMFQDVPVLPRRTYKLQFFVAGAEMDPGDLIVDVRWICGAGGDTGCALEGGPVLVQGKTTGPAHLGAWKAVIAYTEAAPHGADSARIVFRSEPGCGECNYLLVDDVIFSECA